MGVKRPTYEQLKRMVEKLKKEACERKQAERALGKGEERLQSKLALLLFPDVDIGTEELVNIVNIPAIQSLMNVFTELTSIPTAILDIKGNVFEATGWQDICTKFHRIHPETLQHCVDSDLYLAKNIKSGEYVAYRCKNGLWDVATPLYIRDKHVGNIYTGQFFYDDEIVNESDFVAQAEKYGFDKEEYLVALRCVPRFSREKINKSIEFLVKFTDFISQLSYSNLTRDMANQQLKQEITERKCAEETLRVSEERFRIVAESTNDLIWEWDIVTGKLEWFGAIDEKLGYSLGEFPRTIEAWENSIHPDDHDRVMTALDRHLKTKEPYYEEYYVKRKDGTLRFWIDQGKALWDDQGNPYKMIGACTDITERKQAEELFRSLAANSPVGVYIVQQGKFVYANPQLQQYTGYREDELLGMEALSLVFPEDRETVRNNAIQMLKGKRVVPYEFRITNKNGEIKWALEAVASIQYQGKQATIGSYQDITERKRAEKEREKLIVALRTSLENVKMLSGLLPICASCKKIRDDKGYWNQIESYIRDHSEAEFSHGICPECMKKLYPDFKIE